MSALTKKALASALRARLEKNTLDSITVKDITDDCGLNRQTFYYHFQDIYELLEWLLNQEAKDIIASVDISAISADISVPAVSAVSAVSADISNSAASAASAASTDIAVSETSAASAASADPATSAVSAGSAASTGPEGVSENIIPEIDPEKERAAIAALLDRAFDYLVENQNFILNAYNSVNRRIVERFIRQWIEPVTSEIVNRKVEGHEISRDDAEYIIHFCLMMFIGISFEWLDNNMKDEYNFEAEKLILMMDGAIESAIRAFEK